MVHRAIRPVCALLIVALSFGCSARGGNAGSGTLPAVLALEAPPAPRRIQHVVIVIQENRSFNDLFATYPGADGATKAKMSDGRTVELEKHGLAYPYDIGHGWGDWLKAWDNGKMDGFNLEGAGHGNMPAGAAPYQYVDPKEVAPYWDIAKSYVLADRMFQTQGSGSYTAHQDLIRGATDINSTASLIDFPSHQPWGCDSPAGTVTTLITTQLHYEGGKGPFPCLKYKTLRDLLDAKNVSWKYYSPKIHGSTGAVWNAFDSIRAVRYGSEWTTNVTSTNSAFFNDVKNGRLRAVSWLVPDLTNSDHPSSDSDTGPSWVADVVNTIGESAYWKNTAVIVLWDDWGGFYDNVPPPIHGDAGGLGFRVAMLVVSPYARENYISKTQYEFGSILRFVEDNWYLGSLHTTDQRAKSIIDCFDYNQQPRKFVPIPAKYSGAFFAHQRPSGLPVDTE